MEEQHGGLNCCNVRLWKFEALDRVLTWFRAGLSLMTGRAVGWPLGFIRSLSAIGSPNRTPIIGAEKETTFTAPTRYVTLRTE
jgi:hypothetical protein